MQASEDDGGGSSSSDGEQRLLSLRPLDEERRGDQDGGMEDGPDPRYASLDDFTGFLPRPLHIVTDAGPGEISLDR